jgi:hypothetical protein
MGQRIVNSGYMKGGPQPFVDQIDKVLKEDRESRPFQKN